MVTPQISSHARQRCAEMGISTKVAKRIAQHPDMVLPDFAGCEDRRFVYSDTEPDFAIVLDEPANVVVTVLYYDTANCRRRGE